MSMTHGEVIARCVELVGKYPDSDAITEITLARRRNFWNLAAVALAEENDKLRKSWGLEPGTRVIESKPNELLIETKTGDRRRISMADPQKHDVLVQSLQDLETRTKDLVRGVMEQFVGVGDPDGQALYAKAVNVWALFEVQYQ